MRGWIVAGAVTLAAACGDNFVEPVGPALVHSDVLVLVAHEDDDMIFMQPELVSYINGDKAITTVYATTAGPNGRGKGIFDAAKVAYGSIAGSDAWNCGLTELGTIKVEHCRLADHPISLLDFGISDGGIEGARTNSLLHLMDDSVHALPANSGGSVTAVTVVDDFVQLLEATTPDAIETLDLSGTHGRDNSSHMFVASIAMWAAARIGFAGPVTWHRGYNVETENATLDGDGLARAQKMLGFYEACAYHCGACGTACSALTPSHATYIARQYSMQRVREARGKLSLGGQCLDGSLGLGDCATAPELELAATGSLRIGDSCVTSSAAGALSLAPCTGVPEQYWLLDSEGAVWNGLPPQSAPNMAYDHVRCLATGAAPTCGANLQLRWTVLP